MKIAIAGFSLESVSFLEQEVTLEEFEREEIRGAAMLAANRGANTPVGGAIDVCERNGVEMVCVVRAAGEASGPCSEKALEYYKNLICDGVRAVRGEIDGVFLELHGALTTRSNPHADRDLILAVRATLGPELPIAVAFDYHANLDSETIASVCGAFGFHFSPHTDMAETGSRATDCLMRCIRGEIKPQVVLERAWVMVPSISTATDLNPLSTIVAESIALARHSAPYIDVSVFAGFCYADVPSTGFSVVVVSDASEDESRALARRLVAKIWRYRREIYASQPVFGLAVGVQRAIERASRASRPVVLLEHADRMNDSTHVVHELMRQQAKGVAVPFMVDPDGARQAAAAGVGSVVEVFVGGRSSRHAGLPIALRGIVRFAGEREFVGTSDVTRGNQINLGLSAVIDTGAQVFSVISRKVTAIDEGCFTAFGMQARDFKIIVLRSKTHFRAAYATVAEEIIIVDTPDWGPADLLTLPYRHILRDRMFPFCEDFRRS